MNGSVSRVLLLAVFAALLALPQFANAQDSGTPGADGNSPFPSSTVVAATETIAATELAPTESSAGDATAAATSEPTVAPGIAGVQDDDDSPSRNNQRIYQLLMTIVVLGLVAYLIRLFVTRLDKADEATHQLLLTLLDKGKRASISKDSSLFPTAARTMAQAAIDPNGTVPNLKVVISGPAKIGIGEFAQYTLTAPEIDPATITWELNPPNLGMVNANGLTAEVVVRQPASIVLTANVADPNYVGSASIPIDAVAELQADDVVLPNPSAGWGTLMLCTLLLGLAFLVAVMTSEVAAVVTLFGTIAGYIFGRNANLDPPATK